MGKKLVAAAVGAAAAAAVGATAVGLESEVSPVVTAYLQLEDSQIKSHIKKKLDSRLRHV